MVAVQGVGNNSADACITVGMVVNVVFALYLQEMNKQFCQNIAL